MKVRLVLLSMFLFSVIACCVSDTYAASSAPNIILIFVDDMGYGDLACYGNTKNKTPNIDTLAAEGQRWTSFYSSGSTCVPSRKGLMSGRHPVFIPRQTDGLKDDRSALMPAMFKRQGYATAILGKWHLAGYPNDFTVDPMHPLECGFDYHYGTPGSNDVPAPAGKKQTREVFDTCNKFSFPVPLIRGREIVEFPVNQELLTRRYTEQAVKWIEQKNNDRFFLYLAHNMPHAPIFASPEFQNKSAGGRFGDVVEEIDWSVGEIVKAVQRTGVEKETLIVFTSDNGPWSCFGPHGGTAGPLRGEKSTTWEGGQRVPTIFYWPGTIQPASVDGLGANLDLYATFATLIGGSQPSDKPGYISTDLSPTLLEEQPSSRTTWAYHHNAYRSGQYKIHVASNPPTDPIARRRRPLKKYDTPLLFDLDSDLGEQHDIAEQHPDILARLVSEMKAFHSQVQAPNQNN